MGAAHAAALYALLLLPQCHRLTLLFAVCLWCEDYTPRPSRPLRALTTPYLMRRPVTGNAVTAGAHRLWAHRSYEACFALRAFLMLTFSMANQRSIYHWARDHRVHHKHSETDADPHNAKRGFFFAHVGWLLVKKHASIASAGSQLGYDDLLDDWTVTFQRDTDPYLAVFMCFLFPGLVSTLWGDTFWHGLLVAGALRYVAVLHFTWLVNSAAHLYGDHPYDPHSNPAENPAVALLSLGEGWHNWHHKYPFDYAASELGVLRQFNPTKVFIDACCALGLAWRRKRASGAWAHSRVAREAGLLSSERSKAQ